MSPSTPNGAPPPGPEMPGSLVVALALGAAILAASVLVWVTL